MTHDRESGKSAKRDPETLPAPVEEALPVDLEEAAAQAEFPTFDGLHLGPRTIAGLEMMVYEGLDYRIAAERAGVLRHNLIRAYNIPAVRKVYNSITKQLRENAGTRAYRRLESMAQTASSEHVQLEANKWVAGVEGLAPVKRVEGRVSVNHTFGGFDYDADHGPDMRDVTPDTDTQSPHTDEE